MFPVVVGIGFILWKYANGSDSLDPNLYCRISCEMCAYRSAHYLCIKKLGNHRSSERLKCFKSSNCTNLANLIILAGDIETNPSSRFKRGLCKNVQGVGQTD